MHKFKLKDLQFVIDYISIILPLKLFGYPFLWYVITTYAYEILYINNCSVIVFLNFMSVGVRDHRAFSLLSFCIHPWNSYWLISESNFQYYFLTVAFMFYSINLSLNDASFSFFFEIIGSMFYAYGKISLLKILQIMLT